MKICIMRMIYCRNLGEICQEAREYITLNMSTKHSYVIFPRSNLFILHNIVLSSKGICMPMSRRTIIIKYFFSSKVSHL